MALRFDDALPCLAALVTEELGEDLFNRGTVLRDAVGRLSFFSSVPLDAAQIDQLSVRLRNALGAYARTDRVVAGRDDYGATLILSDGSANHIRVGGHRVRLLDRRLVGADWLRKPATIAPPPPRIVFASLKGGVGRTTALSVVAAHLAAHGKRVLAIDLDMEAPGLGSILLTDETLPQFGIIDALVENSLSGLDDEFLADLVGASGLADHRGRIDVVPAFGDRSMKNPAEVLAKIARAYAEDVQPDGTVATILDQVRVLVDRLADPARYDAVLVDARAGLHETTASSVLGLGAEVLLFGLDEPQTFHGYAALLAHLGRFIPPDGLMPEWVERLTMVQGKAPVEANARAGFGQACRDLFAKAGLAPRPPDPPLAHDEAAEQFKNIPWDDNLPDADVLPEESWVGDPLAVLEDSRFSRFEPLRRRDLLMESVYRSSFQSLLDQVDQMLGAVEEPQ